MDSSVSRLPTDSLSQVISAMTACFRTHPYDILRGSTRNSLGVEIPGREKHTQREREIEIAESALGFSCFLRLFLILPRGEKALQ